MSYNRRTAIQLGLAAGAVVLSGGPGWAKEGEGTRREHYESLRRNNPKPATNFLRKFEHIPNVAVQDQTGATFRFYDDLVKDKFVIVNFFYAACHGTCPLVTENLKEVRNLFGERIGRDLFMYSITLRPENDTPEVLKSYTEMHDISGAWPLLTGKPADIEQIRAAIGFPTSRAASDVTEDTHLSLLRYGNDRTRVWSSCPALAHPESIVYAIANSLPDAVSDAKSG
jgi:protein SCO1